jgi:hypothetical protein
MLSQPKSAVHQLPAKLSWQIISGTPPLLSGPVAFFASYWSAGFERFRLDNPFNSFIRNENMPRDSSFLYIRKHIFSFSLKLEKTGFNIRI